jgi:hypothetical protein
MEVRVMETEETKVEEIEERLWAAITRRLRQYRFDLESDGHVYPSIVKYRRGKSSQEKIVGLNGSQISEYLTYYANALTYKPDLGEREVVNAFVRMLLEKTRAKNIPGRDY